MSNDYLQFSETVPCRSKEEFAWFKAVLECEDSTPETDAVRAEITGSDGCDDFWFSFEFAPSRLYVHLYADENGEPYQVGVLMQHYQRKFAPTECFKLTWAEHGVSCGGGAMVVTAKKITIQSCDELVDQMAKEAIESLNS